MKATRIATALVALCALLLPSTAARADDRIYVSTAGEQFRGYTLPVFAIVEGDSMTYANLDLASHNVESDGRLRSDYPDWCRLGRFLEGRCPLFWSPLVGLAEDTPVYGVGDLAPGTYPFICRPHSGAMRGVLVVLDK